MTNTKTTLADHLATLDHPVIWWASIGAPGGEIVAFSEGFTAVPESWLEATGEVVPVEGSSGRGWEWDGEDGPVDWRRNAITVLAAYDDQNLHVDNN